MVPFSPKTRHHEPAHSKASIRSSRRSLQTQRRKWRRARRLTLLPATPIRSTRPNPSPPSRSRASGRVSTVYKFYYRWDVLWTPCRGGAGMNGVCARARGSGGAPWLGTRCCTGNVGCHVSYARGGPESVILQHTDSETSGERYTTVCPRYSTRCWLGLGPLLIAYIVQPTVPHVMPVPHPLRPPASWPPAASMSACVRATHPTDHARHG